MDKKTKAAIDLAFEKADEAFAKADEAFASIDWSKAETKPVDPAHQYLFEFAAPTWKHRRKLCAVFLTMFWRMLWRGQAQLRIPRRNG